MSRTLLGFSGEEQNRARVVRTTWNESGEGKRIVQDINGGTWELEDLTESDWFNAPYLKDTTDEFEEETTAENIDRRSAQSSAAATAKASGEQNRTSNWVENVISTIPIEIVTAWAAIDAIFQVNPDAISTRMYWAAFVIVLIATGFHMWVDIKPPSEKELKERGLTVSHKKKILFVQIVLAMGAFVVWAYYLGGPFQRPPLSWYNPSYAAVILPLYTVLGPQLVPAVITKLDTKNSDSE